MPPRSPNIIWPSLSSIIIHYGRQWPEMLTRPKTSNIHTYVGLATLPLPSDVAVYMWTLPWAFMACSGDSFTLFTKLMNIKKWYLEFTFGLGFNWTTTRARALFFREFLVFFFSKLYLIFMICTFNCLCVFVLYLYLFVFVFLFVCLLVFLLFFILYLFLKDTVVISSYINILDLFLRFSVKKTVLFWNSV